jgi:hypothetical protein
MAQHFCNTSEEIKIENKSKKELIFLLTSKGSAPPQGTGIFEYTDIHRWAVN